MTNKRFPFTKGNLQMFCLEGWCWKVTQMSTGSGYPAVTPGTGLVSKRPQLTGQRYQWADLSGAHASRYFSNCMFFLLFFTLPQFIQVVLGAVDVGFHWLFYWNKQWYSIHSVQNVIKIQQKSQVLHNFYFHVCVWLTRAGRSSSRTVQQWKKRETRRETILATPSKLMTKYF